MGFADKYLSKNSLYSNLVEEEVPKDLSLIVTIPCYNEPSIINSLESLASCDKIEGIVEVFVLINSSVIDSEEIVLYNRNTLKKIENWIDINNFDGIRFYVTNIENLPKKYAGVGLARKIAMDEATRRFNAINKPDGVITGFDADTLCDANYFIELERYFSKKISRGASIYFEHPICGIEFEEKVYEASALYELYLRYYKFALKYAGHPHAFHCIGSAYAVRTSDYAFQGGMNKKQAGEDFYFLQKIIPLGGFGEVNTTRVIPSSRISKRTPFGTGQSINEIKAGDKPEYMTYNIIAFIRLKELLGRVKDFYKCDDLCFYEIMNDLPPDIREYCNGISFKSGVDEINRNCSSLKIFENKFFKYFNILNVLKYLNYTHSLELEKKSVVECAISLLHEMKIEYSVNKNVFDLLKFYRDIEKSV